MRNVLDNPLLLLALALVALAVVLRVVKTLVAERRPEPREDGSTR